VSDSASRHELVVLRSDFAVCRLEPEASIPPWVDKGSFWSACRTADELSIVCEEGNLPADVEAERGFACLGVVGPLEFSMVGVLAGLTAALADRDISVFVVSTFDTDYLLVAQLELPDAIDALRESGHAVHF